MLFNVCVLLNRDLTKHEASLRNEGGFIFNNINLTYKVSNMVSRSHLLMAKQ